MRLRHSAYSQVAAQAQAGRLVDVTRLDRFLPLLLFVFALSVRLVAARMTQFDGLYGQDAFAYYDYSLALRQALAALQPPPPFFWPIGYPLLVVLATLLVGVRPLAGQLVSSVAGALVAVMTYALVRQLRPQARFGATVAGLLVAMAAQLMISSLSVMSDAAALAWATLSALAMLIYCRRLRAHTAVRPYWLALAAFSLAAAIITRWAYVLLILPWSLAALLNWRRAGLRPRQIVLAAAAALVIGAVVIGPQFVFDGGGELSHTGNLELLSWSPATSWKSTVRTHEGVFHFERPVAVFYALAAIHPAFVFPLFAPFLALGLWTLAKGPRAQLALLAGWPLVVYVLVAGIAQENPRYTLAFFPPLAVYVGLGADYVWQRARPRWRPIIVGWCLLALAGSLAWSTRDVARFTAAKKTHLATVQWVESQVPAGANLIAFGLTLTLEHYSEFRTHDIYLLDESSLGALLLSERPLYLLLDPVNVASQWQGKSPQQNYVWLQASGRLTKVGSYAPYTLFRVATGASDGLSGLANDPTAARASGQSAASLLQQLAEIAETQRVPQLD